MDASSGFRLVDFLIFGSSLALSAGIGLFHAIRFRSIQKERNGHLLLGGRQMPALPTALSLLTSFLSGILILAVPAEIYQRGFTMWIMMASGFFSIIVSGLFFIPTLFRSNIVSVYEYLELRFQSAVLRRVGAGLFLLNTGFYMAIATYAPAIALNGVTGVPTWVFILSVGLVCTFYSTLGGLKAVVWTDTVQAAFMFFGVLAALVKATIDSGGPAAVFREVSAHGRLEPLKNIDPSPLQHFSIWIAFFGGFGFWLAQFGLNQMAVQRYCSLRSLRAAYTVTAITAPCYFVLVTLSCLSGLAMFVYFLGCDPLKSGRVRSGDQLMILMVSESLSSIPGLPGLFLAALCSGTLSTVSSGINSLAAVTWTDLIQPFWRRKSGNKEKTDDIPNIVPLLYLLFGVSTTAAAFLCDPLGGLLKSATNILGGLAGPLVGVFVLGFWFPRANGNGALAGILVSLGFLLWISIGNVIYKPFVDYKLPTFTNNCTNASFLNGTEETGLDNSNLGRQDVFVLYRISNWLYPVLGIVIVCLIGLPASFLPIKNRQSREVNLAETRKSNDGIDLTQTGSTFPTAVHR